MQHYIYTISHGHIGLSFNHTIESKEKMSRQRQGDKNIKAKLKEVDVINILELIKLGISDQELSIQFNVAKVTIGKIRTNHCWKHIPRLP